MGPAPNDITGQRFHKLVALELVEVRPGKRDRVRMWRCHCDCGNEPLVAQRNLTAGDTASCGCIVGKHKRTHGATDTPEFMAWVAMRQRCENPRVKAFKDYGARGISVCARWQTFESFLADMGPRPSPAHSIDRERNDGNYEPGNCRWATMMVQSNNRRSSLNLTLNGETHTAAEWERKIGLKAGMISKRLGMGWTPERALATAPREWTKCIAGAWKGYEP